MATVAIKGETAKAVIELATIRTERLAIQKREEVLKGIILQTLEAGDTGTYRGAPVVTVKAIPRTTVDSKKLQAELPEVYEAYSTTGVSNRVDTL